MYDVRRTNERMNECTIYGCTMYEGCTIYGCTMYEELSY